MGDPPALSHAKTNPPGSVGSVPGIDAFEALVHVGMTVLDDKGNLQPRIAEATPAVENGLWTVLPDGRMETSWKIRPNARWHDGTAVTAQDFLFTLRVYQDKELPWVRDANLDLIENASAPDPHTVVVTWTRPFIEADSLFTTELAMPLPRHLLESAYAEDKAHLTDLPYWSEQFVGTGPFKIREWVNGSHAIIEANPDYFLGRPKLDEIELKFIRDGNTLIANVLSETVDLTLGRGLDIEQSLQLRDQRREAQVLYAQGGWVPIYPQFLNPSPAEVLDVRLRRALLHAIERQELTDSINHGLVPVAQAFVTPSEEAYRAIEPAIVRYDYDVRRASQLIEEMGFAKGVDGMYQDASGRRLAVELRTTAQREHHMKALYPVADNWQRLGVATETLVVPIQRIPDREYRTTFPGFELVGGSNGINSKDIKKYHSASAARTENGYRVAGNNARYMSPEFDALIDRYVATIPRQDRLEVLRQIVHHQTDQVTVIGLFYQLRPTIVADRVLDVTPGHQSGNQAWNAHEWSFKTQPVPR
jgi:peptide/nickel transport system substrate-binding protein